MSAKAKCKSCETTGLKAGTLMRLRRIETAYDEVVNLMFNNNR